MSDLSTIRIHIAALAQQGLLASGKQDTVPSAAHSLAIKARQFADSLLEEMIQSESTSPLMVKSEEVSLQVGDCGCRIVVKFAEINKFGMVNVSKPGFMHVHISWCKEHTRPVPNE